MEELVFAAALRLRLSRAGGQTGFKIGILIF